MSANTNIIRLTPEQIDEWRLAKDIDELIQRKETNYSHAGVSPLRAEEHQRERWDFYPLGRGAYRRRIHLTTAV